MNIKKISLSLAVCAALATSGAALASVKAATGVTVGGELGYSFLDSYSTSNLKKSPFAWGIYGGYNYAFSDVMQAGLEIGYNDDGTAKYGSNKAKQTDISLLVTGTYVDPTGFNVFGKVGAARVTEKLTGIAGNNVNKFLPKVGVGIGYMIPSMQGLNVYVSYDHVFGAGKDSNHATNNKPQSIDRIMAGVSYTIPME